MKRKKKRRKVQSVIKIYKITDDQEKYGKTPNIVKGKKLKHEIEKLKL